MTRKVVFELANGIDGEVELLDNGYMDVWRMVYKHNQNNGVRAKRPGVTHVKNVDYERNFEKSQRETEKLGELLDRVNSSIIKIRDLGYPWPGDLLDRSVTNAELNFHHRCFTTMMFTRAYTHDIPLTEKQVLDWKRKSHNKNAPRCYPYTFVEYLGVECINDWYNKNSFDDKFIALEPHLHEINSAVHDIENIILRSDRDAEINNGLLEYLGTTAAITVDLDWNTKLDDNCTDGVKADFNVGNLIYNADTTDDPTLNVQDLKNILGKDYLTAFRNYDDPFNVDICNHNNTTKGGFTISPGYEYVHREHIKPWLDYHEHRTGDWLVHPINIGRISQDWIREFSVVNHKEMPNWEEYKSNFYMVKTDLIEPVAI